jgi:hypothetical protein
MLGRAYVAEPSILLRDAREACERRDEEGARGLAHRVIESSEGAEREAARSYVARLEAGDGGACEVLAVERVE